MAFGLASFKTTALGRRVGAIVEDPRNIAEMIVFSRHEMPAVQAIGKALLVLGPEVRNDYVKTTIGRWVKEVLGTRGWVPWKSARVSPGNLFSRGMIYSEEDKRVEIEARGRDIVIRRTDACAAAEALAAAEEIIEESRSHSLGDVTVRELLDEGRRG
jgi:hypothetical protein